MDPEDTLRKRVEDSARDYGWVGTSAKDQVPSRWHDREKVHVYLYIDRGPGECHLLQLQK
jgi:hypothetical protein